METERPRKHYATRAVHLMREATGSPRSTKTTVALNKAARQLIPGASETLDLHKKWYDWWRHHRDDDSAAEAMEDFATIAHAQRKATAAHYQRLADAANLRAGMEEDPPIDWEDLFENWQRPDDG